jgi:Fe-S cluster assembly iron-binding protein IscA
METPQLELTPRAQDQIRLIKLNDYTLSELDFRIKIGGKGCGGFTYETGFSERRSDDLILNIDECVILMDPFTAFYTQNSKLDFKVDMTLNEDGFVVENFAGQKYAGKFFKDTTLVPQWEKSP